MAGHYNTLVVLFRMVAIGKLVDDADLPNESKPKVKDALVQLGYRLGDEVGPALLRVEKVDLLSVQLTVAEANAVLAALAPTPLTTGAPSTCKGTYLARPGLPDVSSNHVLAHEFLLMTVAFRSNSVKSSSIFALKMPYLAAAAQPIV